MKSSARKLMALTYLSVPVLLLGLAGCGLKGPLYLPDEKQEEVPARAEPATPVLEGSRVRTLPPAPQSQKKDRERERANPPAEPSQSQPAPVSPPDPDRPATTPPPGQ